MSRFFFGQDLSARRFQDRSADPLRLRIWLALRYVIVVASVIAIGVLFDRSPAGAFLVGLGGGAFLSGLVDTFGLPGHERSQKREIALIAGGAVLALIGSYILTSA
jgi:hypothetical protein